MSWLRALRKIAGDARRGRSFESGVRVLAYHGVVERYTDPRVEESFHTLADFRAQLALLARCPVVPLDQIEEARRRRLPAIAITFDDGFANNLLAAELLADAKLPATFFISAGNVTRGETIWPTLLRLVLARGSARTLELAGRRYVVDDAFREIRDTLKRMPAGERRTAFARLVAQLGPGELAELEAQVPSLAMMSWRDVEALSGAGFEIGSHGWDHELQHAAQPADVREHELVASRAAITRTLARPCVAFAFPNGTTHAGSAEDVARAGYDRAFTMQSASTTRAAHPMLLPRLVATGGAEALATKLLFGN